METNNRVVIFNIDVVEKNKIGVYRITNLINKKIYIGSTTTNFRHRYLQYCSAYNRNLKNQPVLFRAFRKYGFENFIFEVVKICEKENCLKIEQLYIDLGTQYNSCPIAGSLLGYKHPRDSKTRTVLKGNHHSAKSVDMHSISGVFIRTFTSVVEAQEYIGIKSKTNISQCCIEKTFSAGGYRWTYSGESLRIRSKGESRKTRVELSKGELKFIASSQKEASEYIKSFGYKCNQGRINRSLNKSGEKVYGFELKRL